MMNRSEINNVNRMEVKYYQCEMMSMEWRLINGMEARMEVKLLIKWRFAYYI